MPEEEPTIENVTEQLFQRAEFIIEQADKVNKIGKRLPKDIILSFVVLSATRFATIPLNVMFFGIEFNAFIDLFCFFILGFGLLALMESRVSKKKVKKEFGLVNGLFAYTDSGKIEIFIMILMLALEVLFVVLCNLVGLEYTIVIIVVILVFSLSVGSYLDVRTFTKASLFVLIEEIGHIQDPSYILDRFDVEMMRYRYGVVNIEQLVVDAHRCSSMLEELDQFRREHGMDMENVEFETNDGLNNIKVDENISKRHDDAMKGQNDQDSEI